MHTRWNKVYDPSKKGHRISLIGLCLIWWGCTEPQEASSTQQVPVSSATVEISLDVSEVFAPPQMLELKLPEDQAIGAVKRILRVGTHWAVLHQMLGEAGYTLTVFTGDGSYIFGLRRDAAIPGTFSPKDIFLAPSGQLGILDQTGSRLLEYDLTGQALSERPLPCMAQTVAYEPVSDQYVLTRGRQSANNEDTSYFYNLLFLDSALTLVQKFDPYTIPVGERAIVNFPNPVTIAPDGTVYYARLFTDHLSAFQQGLRTPTRDIAFEMDGGLASVKEGMENNGNMVELVQEYLNGGSMLLAGNFFWAGNAPALYFNLLSVEGPVFGLHQPGATQPLLLARQLVRDDGGALPFPVTYDPAFGFISLLNDFSLQYTPEAYLKGELIEGVIDNNKCYLVFSNLMP